MTTLQAQQQALLQAITAQAPPADTRWLRASPGGAAPRLGIYRHAYRARLAAALADNHTVLQRALGDDAFAELAAAYVAACPSTTPSIRWFGDRLADYMCSREDLVPHPALVDLARMDWALRAAFDASDAAELGLGALANVAPQQFAGLRFTAHPSVRLLVMDWTIEPAWRTLREHDPASGADEPQLPEPEAAPHTLLVWRRQLDTQWRSLSALEAALLQAAFDGEPFGALCERAAAALDGDAEQAAATCAGALQQWLQDGLFCAVQPALG
ncbi:HvfC/BufC family peptide modification chaperone [Ideonella sp. BN130291]|uniref:HvfC/BufC family peptide modification chaperone n=1 Tax=Ideonella sp. BN130291 TaxID=3112940 RepID=UPI002E25B673|nr:putative DNA-binding domain-containing protein [Ideonella sp. BN130291]